MSKRVKLLNRTIQSKMNPFLLCNILARRTRQIAARRTVNLEPELINRVFEEFLEGELTIELGGRGPRLASGIAKDGAAERQGGFPIAEAAPAAQGWELQPLPGPRSLRTRRCGEVAMGVGP